MNIKNWGEIEIFFLVREDTNKWSLSKSYLNPVSRYKSVINYFLLCVRKAKFFKKVNVLPGERASVLDVENYLT